MSFISVNSAGSLVVSCPYESRDKVKSAGGKWDPVLKKWVLAFTPETVEAVIDAVPEPEVHPDVEKKLVEIVERDMKLRKIRAMAKEDYPVRMKIPGLKGSLYNYQKLGVMFSLVNGCGVLLGDEMGLGKENPVDTPVLSKSGWVEMGSLRVGDEIYSSDGKLHKVTGVFPQGVKEIVRVVFSDGVSAECGWEHLWKVQSENDFRRDRGWRVMDAETLSKDLFFGKKRKRCKWRIPLVEPVEYSHVDLDVPPYLIGVLLGDGSLTNNGVTFVPGDKEVPKVVERYIGEKYSVNENADYGTSTRFSVVFNGHGNPMSRAITGMGIRKTAESKFIPDDYKRSGIEQRKLLLAGLMDTDGCAMGARSRFYTTSERLADDVIEVVRSLGGMATKSLVKGRKRMRRGKISQERDCWHLVIRTSFNPFMAESKRKRWKPSSKLVRNIVSIEPSRKSEAVCISVSSPDSTYLLNDFIVTHNTLQGIATALCLKERGEIENALIVVPPSLKFNWALEIEKWTTEPCVVIDGTPEERLAKWLNKKAFFFVVNFELLLEDLFGGREYKPKKNETDDERAKREKRMAKTKRRAKILAPMRERLWGMIVIDEAHALKNNLSKRSRNVRSLRAKYRMALTGTPLDGRLEELYSVMEFVSPGLLGSHSKFMQRHAETDYFGKVVRYRRIGEVREKIAPYFIRRLKKDVLKDLPDKVYSNRMVELSAAEKKVYRELAENGHSATEDAAALVAVIRCKQFCDSPRLIADALEAGGNTDRKEIEKLRKMKSSKLEMLRDVLQEVVIENAHKVLVFSQYAEMVKILMELFDEMGLKYLCIWGETDKKLRADYQKMFNEDKTIDVMVGTEAMSTGLNFTAADCVINYDDNWAPAFMAQREDRAHRIGQRNVVNVINFICMDTIEERIRSVLYQKSKISAQALGDALDEMVLKRLGPQDTAKLL